MAQTQVVKRQIAVGAIVAVISTQYQAILNEK